MEWSCRSNREKREMKDYKWLLDISSAAVAVITTVASCLVIIEAIWQPLTRRATRTARIETALRETRNELAEEKRTKPEEILSDRTIRHISKKRIKDVERIRRLTEREGNPDLNADAYLFVNIVLYEIGEMTREELEWKKFRMEYRNAYDHLNIGCGSCKYYAIQYKYEEKKEDYTDFYGQCRRFPAERAEYKEVMSRTDICGEYRFDNEVHKRSNRAVYQKDYKRFDTLSKMSPEEAERGLLYK